MQKPLDCPSSPIPSYRHVKARCVYAFETAQAAISAFGVPTKSVVLYECPETGTRFRVPPPQEELIGLHEDSYQAFYSDGAEAAGDHDAGHAEACRAEWRARAEYLKTLCPSGRVFDVGCSTGVLLHELADLGFEVAGCDVSVAACAEAARKIGGDRVVHGTVQDYARQAEGAQFDAITLMDVIEHFDDPVGPLETIHQLLKPGGILFLRTPALSSPFFRIADLSHALSFGRYRRAVQLAYHAEHIYFFTRKGLLQLLEDTGFRPVVTAPDPLLWDTFRTAELKHGIAINAALATLYWGSRLTGGGHGIKVAARKVG